ncbi:DUF6957 family protein [Geopseudomonas aromaticivorans]
MHSHPSLEQITDFFFQEGVRLRVPPLTTKIALDLAHATCPGKATLVVTDWMMLDLDLPPHALEKLAAHGCTPTVVFASTVLHDSQQKLREGAWTRSGFLLHLHRGFLFETPGAVVALVGDGHRKRVSADLLAFIPHWRPLQAT